MALEMVTGISVSLGYNTLMKLLHDYLLIRVDKTPESSKGGIMLTDANRRLPNTGTVEAIGNRVSAADVGARVIFLRYSSIDGPEEDLRICKEEHVVGILDASEGT